MDILKSAVLGIIQGLTEFFPVSSSGHLVIFPYFFKWEQPSLFFAVILHLGTLLSLLIILYRDVINIIKSFFKGIFNKKYIKDENFKMALFIIIAIIPAALVGYFINDFIEDIFSKPVYAAFFLLITAAVLLIFEYIGKRNENRYLSINNEDKKINYFIALITGIGQAVAILPGISRSGLTISSARIFGIKREKAVKFSFLISIPVIFGSFIFELYDLLKEKESIASDISIIPLIVGFIAAFLSGLFAIKFLMKISAKRNLNFFALYCVILALIFFIIYFLRK
ncbi:MAG: undecaprenyl-diphosphate phosphatase [Actinomycetota bacterium]|jgi:undecaprenyl-diphosphatase|nr:undecaprenyl-diphosphate phosphatase [Actinomycetota bacterium]